MLSRPQKHHKTLRLAGIVRRFSDVGLPVYAADTGCLQVKKANEV